MFKSADPCTLSTSSRGAIFYLPTKSIFDIFPIFSSFSKTLQKGTWLERAPLVRFNPTPTPPYYSPFSTYCQDLCYGVCKSFFKIHHTSENVSFLSWYYSELHIGGNLNVSLMLESSQDKTIWKPEELEFSDCTILPFTWTKFSYGKEVGL